VKPQENLKTKVKLTSRQMSKTQVTESTQVIPKDFQMWRLTPKINHKRLKTGIQQSTLTTVAKLLNMDLKISMTTSNV